MRGYFLFCKDEEKRGLAPVDDEDHGRTENVPQIFLIV